MRLRGPDHPETLIADKRLGYWRRRAGNAAGAVTAYEALLITTLRVRGPDHADTFYVRYQRCARAVVRVATARGEMLGRAHRARVRRLAQAREVSQAGNV